MSKYYLTTLIDLKHKPRSKIVGMQDNILFCYVGLNQTFIIWQKYRGNGQVRPNSHVYQQQKFNKTN